MDLVETECGDTRGIDLVGEEAQVTFKPTKPQAKTRSERDAHNAAVNFAIYDLRQKQQPFKQIAAQMNESFALKGPDCMTETACRDRFSKTCDQIAEERGETAFTRGIEAVDEEARVDSDPDQPPPRKKLKMNKLSKPSRDTRNAAITLSIYYLWQEKESSWTWRQIADQINEEFALEGTPQELQPHKCPEQAYKMRGLLADQHAAAEEHGHSQRKDAQCATPHNLFEKRAVSLHNEAQSAATMGETSYQRMQKVAEVERPANWRLKHQTPSRPDITQQSTPSMSHNFGVVEQLSDLDEVEIEDQQDSSAAVHDQDFELPDEYDYIQFDKYEFIAPANSAYIDHVVARAVDAGKQWSWENVERHYQTQPEGSIVSKEEIHKSYQALKGRGAPMTPLHERLFVEYLNRQENNVWNVATANVNLNMFGGERMSVEEVKQAYYRIRNESCF